MKKIILLIASMTAFAFISNAQFVIENFDGTSQGYWSNTTSGGQAFNPTATLTGLSGSTYCGYSKRGGGSFDNIVYTLNSNSLFTGTTVSALKNGTLKFKMNLATQASIGITVKIKLQNSTITGQINGFAGNSEYDAITTIGGSSNPYNWETLTFGSATGINASVPDNQVDQIVIFFAFNGSGSTDQFFFDNLQVFDPTVTTTGTTTAFLGDYSAEDAKTSIYPNPSTGLTTIDYDTDNASSLKVTLNDMMGREIQTVANNSGSNSFKGQVDASTLEPGIYYVTFQQNGVSKRLKKLMVTN
ncbi:MAG: T9SS type A sorting domain-containing protein [Cytophagales bacterium]|nr:T9SS type A sorting domain-containing protein [Cytophagales bacterium]